jgi:hypothetical protein
VGSKWLAQGIIAFVSVDMVTHCQVQARYEWIKTAERWIAEKEKMS